MPPDPTSALLINDDLNKLYYGPSSLRSSYIENRSSSKIKFITGFVQQAYDVIKQTQNLFPDIYD